MLIRGFHVIFGYELANISMRCPGPDILWVDVFTKRTRVTRQTERREDRLVLKRPLLVFLSMTAMTRGV